MGVMSNDPNIVLRLIQRLSDETFERFVKLERRRRRQATRLFEQERDRWSYRRGLTKRDQVEVMRRLSQHGGAIMSDELDWRMA
jgi:hypothetical protein